MTARSEVRRPTAAPPIYLRLKNPPFKKCSNRPVALNEMRKLDTPAAKRFQFLRTKPKTHQGPIKTEAMLYCVIKNACASSTPHLKCDCGHINFRVYTQYLQRNTKIWYSNKEKFSVWGIRSQTLDQGLCHGPQAPKYPPQYLLIPSKLGCLD